MDNWSPCPRCGSNRVEKLGKWAVSFIFFGGAGIFMFLGFLLPILWIAVPIMFILSVVSLFGKDTWRCKDCNYSWVDKKSSLNT